MLHDFLINSILIYFCQLSLGFWGFGVLVGFWGPVGALYPGHIALVFNAYVRSSDTQQDWL